MNAIRDGFDIKEIKNDKLNELYYDIDHKSGLKIYVMPKPEYASAYAIFGTRYGSIDNKFRVKGEEAYTEVPEGIAHFLEHKLFENEDGDAFERYAKTGASANAYTSFDRTCYLFSCSENYTASLEILLDFVQSPYFTKETVQKEQGIIGQEIKMNDDEPHWQVFFNLLKALFHNHPVKIDIAGTVESIAKIDAELLYKCYGTFYNLNNMALAIAGNVDLNETLEVIEKNIKSAEKIEIERFFDDEPEYPVTDKIVKSFSVAAPLFALGFKETNKGMKSLKEKIESAVALEIIAGDSSELYETLINENLINTSFYADFNSGRGYALSTFQGESSDPEKVAEKIKAEISRILKEGVSGESFERIRKSLYGQTVMDYNSIDTLANALFASFANGYGLFDELDIYENLTKEDIERRIKEMFDMDKCSLSLVVSNDD